MTIELHFDGAIAQLRLNNSTSHNALGAAELEQFMAQLNAAKANADCRVLVISNSGSTFCAGASLHDFRNGSMSGELFSTLTNSLAEFTLPTIAAIQGNAYGGGAELALCCDFRIGAPTMRMFVPPARLGLCYPLDGMQHFIDRLGLNTTKRLLLAAEEFSGEQLLALGYLTHLVMPDAIASTATNLATQISQLAPRAVSTMKQLCNHIAAGTIAISTAQQAIDSCNSARDLQEGLAAAAEKRQAQFTGA